MVVSWVIYPKIISVIFQQFVLNLKRQIDLNLCIWKQQQKPLIYIYVYIGIIGCRGVIDVM